MSSEIHQPGQGLHVAVIMDGNGRWAKARGLPRTAGHREGAKAVQRTVEAAVELEVGTLTLYAFSADNWQRPREELYRILSFLGLDVAAYDFDAAEHLPVRGSSESRRHANQPLDWRPVERTPEFSVIGEDWEDGWMVAVYDQQ